MATNSALPPSPPALGVSPPDITTNVAVPEALRDVKPPVPILNLQLLIGGAILLALLIALWLAWYLRQRRQRKPPPPTLVVIPPERRARDQLRAALELIHDPKAFTILVANTLRIYLEERFDFRAPERTTEEFLQEIQGSSALTSKHKEILADFLTRCDLVKFAQHQPAEPELRGLLDTALMLVEETSVPADPAETPTA